MTPLRIDGVPVHALVVHFPVAAWTAASLLAFARPFGGPAWVADAALACNAVGLVTGAVAAAAGALEYAHLPDEPQVRAHAVRHALLAGSAWFAYALALVAQAAAPAAAAAAAYAAAFGLLVAAGHAGARLVFHHRIPR